MVEAFTPTRATIGDLARQVEEKEFQNFTLIAGIPQDEESRRRFDLCSREQFRDPRFEFKLIKDEIRVLPLVNLLRNNERGKDEKLGSIPLDHEALIDCAKSIGIKMREDRLITAVARLVKRQEAE